MLKIRKIIISLITLMLAFMSICIVSAEKVSIEPDDGKSNAYDTSSNYYGKTASTSSLPAVDESVLDGYTLITTSSSVSLYLDKTKFNLAIKDSTGYIYYSPQKFYGYYIEASKSTGEDISTTKMLVDGSYTFKISKGSKVDTYEERPTITYTNIENGLKARFDFGSLGIIINVYLRLIDGSLNIYVPKDEIEENGLDVSQKQVKTDSAGKIITDDYGIPITETIIQHYDFYLRSFEFFPYFGAVGYYDEKLAGDEVVYKAFSNVIDGYNLIPDGSGALSRFQYSREYSTRYSKKIYGKDYGIETDSSLTTHLSDEEVVSIPLYGVAHGSNEHAFICVVSEGDGATEVYLEPFGYSHLTLQTSYFKFYVREQYAVDVATSDSGSIKVLPKQMYNNNISYTYSFLEGNQANYSGMAALYREKYLNLGTVDEKDNISLGLNVLAQDYKNILFFKSFVKTTKYKDLLSIIKDLEKGGVADFSISYKGWNRGGYYNNNNYKPRISYRLGSRKQYNELISYINSKDYDLASWVDVSTSYKLMNNDVVKKFGLQTFSKGSDALLFEETYLRSVSGASEKITKYNKQYSKLGIDEVNLSSFGTDIYSYRYKNRNYSRSEVIQLFRQEMSKLNNYHVSLVKANSYAYDYVSKIYESSTSSSMFTYMTDSIPFVSLVLSGHVEMYSEEINFVSDYDKYCLRLIEYNIYPYFTITNSDSSTLRYTNSENIYTSKYSLWDEKIKLFYNYTNKALSSVIGAEMVSHEYVAEGVAKVTYSNGKTIYINHNSTSVTVDSLTLSPISFEVK